MTFLLIRCFYPNSTEHPNVIVIEEVPPPVPETNAEQTSTELTTQEVVTRKKPTEKDVVLMESTVYEADKGL